MEGTPPETVQIMTTDKGPRHVFLQVLLEEELFQANEASGGGSSPQLSFPGASMTFEQWGHYPTFWGH